MLIHIDISLIDTRQQQCIMYHEKVAYYFKAHFLHHDYIDIFI